MSDKIKDFSKGREAYFRKNYPVSNFLMPVIKIIAWLLIIGGAGVSFLFFLDAEEKWWEGLLYLVPLGISLILITELFIIQVDKTYFLYKQTEEKL